MQVQHLALLLAASTTLVVAHAGLRGSALDVGGGAPAPSAPEKELDTLEVKWEIANLNYYDLTKPYVPSSNVERLADKTSVEKLADGFKKRKQSSKESSVDPLAVLRSGVDNMADSIDDVVDSAAPAAALPGIDQLGKGGSLLALQPRGDGVVTVQKALRRAIEDSFKQLICDQTEQAFSGPSPAPALAPASVNIPPPINAELLSLSNEESVPMPAPAPSPAAMACATPKVHVIFAPGKPMKQQDALLLQGAQHFPPVSTMVKMTMFDRPNNGVNDLVNAKLQIQQGLSTGAVTKMVSDVVHKVTNVLPKIGGLVVEAAKVKAWDIDKCENHMTKVVKTFTVHYTKRQVPMALYNECTTFMSKISFSHDYVLDHSDEVRCRKATRSFALKWKLGKIKKPQYFEEMCVGFCEAKYGNDAPTCHITAGDKLADQPL